MQGPCLPASSPQAPTLGTANLSPGFGLCSQSLPLPKMWSSQCPLLTSPACAFLFVFQNPTWTSNFLRRLLGSPTPHSLSYASSWPLTSWIIIFDLSSPFFPIVFELLKRREWVYSLASRVSGIGVHAWRIEGWVRLVDDSGWSQWIISKAAPTVGWWGNRVRD